MANVHIYRLPKSSDPEVLETQIRQQMPLLKALRLTSLQADPQNFYSKYDDEVNQPDSFWLDRIRPMSAQHFVAVASHGQTQVDPEIDEKTKALGYLVLIRESSNDQANVQQQHSGQGETNSKDLPTYFLAVTAIDPAVRSQGIGSKLIRESMIFVKDDARRLGWPTIRYRLGVKASNIRALQLYRKLGFEIDQDPRPEEKEAEDEVLMCMRMDL